MIFKIIGIIIGIATIVLLIIGIGTTIEARECKDLCEESDLDYFNYVGADKQCYCEALAPNIIKMDMNISREVSENGN